VLAAPRGGAGDANDRSAHFAPREESTKVLAGSNQTGRLPVRRALSMVTAIAAASDPSDPVTLCGRSRRSLSPPGLLKSDGAACNRKRIRRNKLSWLADCEYFRFVEHSGCQASSLNILLKNALAYTKGEK
jgi:hypothetical protein